MAHKVYHHCGGRGGAGAVLFDAQLRLGAALMRWGSFSVVIVVIVYALTRWFG